MAKPKPLGRRTPTDWRHYEKYPLTAATTPTAPTPVAIGVNWYEDFDSPVQKGSRSWIGLDSKQLGKVRGGHCVCLKPKGSNDPDAWWDFYNQGSEGACVGFGISFIKELVDLDLAERFQLKDDFDARQVHPLASGEKADDAHPLDIRLRVEAQVVATMGAEQPLFLVDPQRPRMDACELRRDADEVPRALEIPTVGVAHQPSGPCDVTHPTCHPD